MSQRSIFFVQQGGGISGSARGLEQLVMALQSKGINCFVLLGSDGSLYQSLSSRGIWCRIGPIASFTHNTSSPFNVSMLFRFLLTLPPCVKMFRDYLREWKPDLVYLNTSVLLGPALAARAMGIPVVWHVREPFGQHPLLSPLMQKMIRLLSHSIVVNSDYVAREFPNCAYVYRVYNGVDLSRFDPYKVKRDRIRSELGISSDEPLIGMISVIARVKGHLVLLQAAPRVLEEFPSAKFLIVGGSPLPMGYHKTWRGRIRRLLGQEVDDEANLRSTVREAGLEKSFVFTGFRRDVPEILADLDLLVFPSIVPEGFGRPLIEAGAMEVPVVASRLGPHPEIVLDGETGLLVPPNDSDALAESILTLLRNPAYTRQLGKAARQRVSKLFSLESYVSGIEQVLRHVEL